ncbi:molybdenum cofactor guanylyltransferase [Candidatus Bipolaricaulota bacterium]|nr:molybdenum cofactor guanylyltransferase [Candidatus Bipolaricaulota bacterium]
MASSRANANEPVEREEATLIILAGGAGKRMGFPKHELAMGETSVLERIHQRLGDLCVETIVVGQGISSPNRKIRTAEDLYSERGALVGIHGGLSASRTDLTFVVACDMPHVGHTLVSHLLGAAADADIVVPVIRGYYEPLCAVYRTTCLRPIGRSIEGGILKIVHFYHEVRVREIHEQKIREFDPNLRSFVNLNTPAERRLAASFDVSKSRLGDL